MGRFHALLPEELRRDAVRRASALDEVATFLRNATLTDREDPAPAFWSEL